MFCPHCGLESNGELNYCKRCGGNLNLVALAPASESHPSISTGTAFVVGCSTVGLTLIGLFMLFMALSEMRGGGAPPDVLRLTIIFGALTILGSVVTLTCLWAYLLGGKKHGTSGTRLNATAAPNELGNTPREALPDRQPSSVVEHTTRTLEHSRRR